MISILIIFHSILAIFFQYCFQIVKDFSHFNQKNIDMQINIYLYFNNLTFKKHSLTNLSSIQRLKNKLGVF